MTNKNYVLNYSPNFIIRKNVDRYFGKTFRVVKPEWAQNVYFSEGKTEAKAWKLAKERVMKIIDESIKMETIVELSPDVEERNKAARRLLWLNPTENQLSLIEKNCTVNGIINVVSEIVRLNVDISQSLIEWCRLVEQYNSKVTIQPLKTFDVVKKKENDR